jgi:hypothetical protein
LLDTQDPLAKHLIRGKLFGPVTESLMALRGIDTKQPDSVLGPIFKNGDGVAICHTDHFSDDHIFGTGLDDKCKYQYQQGNGRSGSIEHGGSLANQVRVMQISSDPIFRQFARYPRYPISIWRANARPLPHLNSLGLKQQYLK